MSVDICAPMALPVGARGKPDVTSDVSHLYLRIRTEGGTVMQTSTLKAKHSRAAQCKAGVHRRIPAAPICAFCGAKVPR